MQKSYNQKESDRNIKIGAIVSYIVIFVNIACGFIFTPWLARSIGQSQYGLYTLAIALINMFLIDFGISASISRFIAKYEAEVKPEKVKEFVALIAKVYFYIDILIAVAFIVIALFLDKIYVALTPDELTTFRTIFIICAVYNVISFPITTLSTGFLNAYELFGIQKVCGVISKIAQVVLSVVALKLGFGIYSIVVINAICGLAGTVAKMYFVKKKTPVRFQKCATNKKMIEAVFSFTVWAAITGIAERLTYNIQPSILGITSSSIAVAVFGAASALESYIYTFTTAINVLFLPRVSHILAEEKNDELMNLTIKVGKLQYIITGWIFAGFVAIGSQFLVLWMGEEYEMAYICTIFMVAPCLLSRPQQIANTSLIARGNVKEMALVDAGMILLNIGISFVLSKSLGAIGASIGICVGSVFSAVLRCVLYYNLLNLDIKRLILECYIRIGIPIILTLGVAYFIHKKNIYLTWLNLAIGGCIISIVYFSLCYLLGLNKKEQGKIRMVFKGVK